MATPTRRKLHAGSGRNGTSICGRRRGYSTIGDERPRPPAGFMNLSEARGCRQADIAWTGVVFCALAVFAPLIAAVAARGMAPLGVAAAVQIGRAHVCTPVTN